MAAFEHTRTIGHVEFDLNSMPKQARRNFIADTYDAVNLYYSDPANRAKFAEWKKKRDAEREKRKATNASA